MMDAFSVRPSGADIVGPDAQVFKPTRATNDANDPSGHWWRAQQISRRGTPEARISPMVIFWFAKIIGSAPE
jgi:hypothetical protein